VVNNDDLGIDRGRRGTIGPDLARGQDAHLALTLDAVGQTGRGRNLDPAGGTAHIKVLVLPATVPILIPILGPDHDLPMDPIVSLEVVPILRRGGRVHIAVVALIAVTRGALLGGPRFLVAL
jgi:hypothetical protein